jgi:AcrR family transcriptional regulator
MVPHVYGAPIPLVNPKPRADAVRNRARVLATTIEMMRTKGPNVSVDEIARAAGVGVGTVVRSFGGKQKLIDSAIAELLTPIVDRARAAARHPHSEGLVGELFLDLALFQSENRVLATTADGEMPQTQRLREELVANVTEVVECARRAGTVRADLTMSDVVLLVAGVAHAADQTAGSLEQLRRYVTILADGLRPAHPTELPSVGAPGVPSCAGSSQPPGR